jgi:hypothetical protein
MGLSAPTVTRVVAQVVIRDAAMSEKGAWGKPGAPDRTTITRTFDTPLRTTPQATPPSPLRVIPRAEKGRMGREKGVSHRSTTVTHGQQRTLENRP